MNVLKEELVGPNPYDRRYTIDPHADCTGEGCGDVAVLEFVRVEGGNMDSKVDALRKVSLSPLSAWSNLGLGSTMLSQAS